MPSQPPKPRPDVHHGKLCWITRWYGDPDPTNGKRPQYTQRWYVQNEKRATALYAAWLARWDQDPLMQDPHRERSLLSVSGLCAAYLLYAERTYTKQGSITTHVYKVQATLQRLINHYGDLQAEAIDMAGLASWRDALAKQGSVGRRYINDMLQIVASMYRWAAERGAVAESAYHSVRSVARLAKNRSPASERKRIKPVAWETVADTLPHSSTVIANMVWVLWHTGMRPEDVCEMRGRDLEQGGEVWLYRPASHKTDHLDGTAGEERIIAIGPLAQKAVRPHLKKDLSVYLFQPVEGSGRRQQHYGSAYTTSSLRQAIHRACDVAWPPPAELQRRRVAASGRKKGKWETHQAWRKRLSKERWAALLEWRQTHRWNPNQLRHAKGTALRKQYGLEAARLVLGHRHIATTEIYSDRDLQQAIEIAKEVG